MRWTTLPIGFSFCFAFGLLLGAEEQDPAAGHPRPSYEQYSGEEIEALAAAVRKSRPQMHRGGWEWDRLLSRFIDGGRRQENELRIIRAYFLSILDRYRESKQDEKTPTLTLFYNHKSWGSGGRMRIFAELVRQGELTAGEQAEFRELVSHSLLVNFPDYSKLELGVNNRPYGINAGPALAVRMFPKMPAATRHRPWLDALWSELVEYGDTTETNYFPYGPLYLQGLLDMAEGMGKFETERDFLYVHARRYLDYVHGGGVRGNPNSGARIIHDRARLYADPWNAEYYAGAERVNDAHVWYRLAKHYRDPEFLWASEQALLGGRPPPGSGVPAEYMDAYRRRYGWFFRRGIRPRVPAGKSKIGYFSPLKHKVPERLYLGPSRESGQPFVSYFLYDRNNNYMHCCDDAGGRLYEYCVDGAKLLHTSGKYSSGRAGVAETAYDLLSVLSPDMDFPVDEKGKMSTPSDGTWKLASMAVKLALNCRTGPDSKNWFYDTEIDLFRRRDHPKLGYAHGNMDGYWYLNNDYHLRSVYLGTYKTAASFQNLRLGGPKGEKILAAFDTIPENLEVALEQGEESRVLTGEERARALSIVEDGRREGSSLRLHVPAGSTLSLTLKGLDETFDAQNEYTRVSYDFKGQQAGFRLNGRTLPIYYHSLYNRGAILVRDSLRAENKGNDSFGRFTYRNFYGARSRWTRQTVLTAEGILVVRDEYEPCRDVDGYQASPCWLLMAEGEIGAEDRNWFDAPARDHAWWQKQKKRVLLYLHPGEGLSIGQVAHRASQDIGGATHNAFARAVVRAGQPQVWLSVLVPFNEGGDAAELARKIRTSVDEKGSASVTVGRLKVTIGEDGAWSVKRQSSSLFQK